MNKNNFKKNQKKRDLISVTDFSTREIQALIDQTRLIKAKPQQFATALKGKTLAMLFQKPSTRTTVSFAAGMVELGGYPLILNPQELQLKRGETIPDTAKVFSRFVSGIMIRANRHEDVELLAKEATIPVISGLTDKEHPCQVFSDLFTIVEQLGLRSAKGLAGVKVAYLGDGNNMVHSWLLASACMGIHFSVACPKGYEPEPFFVQKAKALARLSGSKLLVSEDPAVALKDADFVYTDVWASMGMDSEIEQRKKVFRPYQLNDSVLSYAKKTARVMHCLPAHRGEEISASVMDGSRSIVFDQAENRLHMQKAILLSLLS